MKFKEGDRVRVDSSWFAIHPKSPLQGTLIVCKPGNFHQVGEIPIEHAGKIWYVPERYVHNV